MVPLTSSLYVPGHLDNEHKQLMVEVGAGYFIEQNYAKAQTYCERKSKLLGESGQKVADIINNKKLQLSKVNLEYNKRVHA
jgi:prefoldin alpha subunit